MPVTEIHVVCEGRRNVVLETDDEFITGWWAIAARHIKPGVIFALHEQKAELSYLHGEVAEITEQDGDRIQVRVRRDLEPRRWRGLSSGERGYLYADLGQFDALPRVPCVIGPVDSAKSPAFRNLLESADWSYPRADEILLEPMANPSERQKEFEANLLRIWLALGRAPIPYAFRDAAGEPFKFDEGAVQYALGRDVVALPHLAGDDIVTSLILAPNAGLGHHGLIATAAETKEAEDNADQLPIVVAEYDPGQIEPQVILRLIETRPRIGQGAFKQELMRIYDGRCAVTGCAVEAVLEGAHIVPHSEVGGVRADVRNGVLLRSDVHGLFDAGLLGFRFDNGGRLRVEVHGSLLTTAYGGVHGCPLRMPNPPHLRPSKICVDKRMQAQRVRS